MSGPLTDEQLAALEERLTYLKLLPEKDPASVMLVLVVEVRRLREQNERLVNICVKHGIPIPAEMLALIQALTRAGEQEP